MHHVLEEPQFFPQTIYYRFYSTILLTLIHLPVYPHTNSCYGNLHTHCDLVYPSYL